MEEGKRGSARVAGRSVLLHERKPRGRVSIRTGNRLARTDGHDEDGKWVETRQAEIVSLHCVGTNPTELQVRLKPCRATERLAFEHDFDPEGVVPLESF